MPAVISFAPIAKAPPVVTILTAPVPSLIVPVIFNPPALSLIVNPPTLVNAPKLVRTFAPPKVTVDAVLPVKVFAVITSVCVTAPVMSPPTPKMTVPVAPTPTVTVSIATVLASCIVTAAAPTLVVVKSPARLIAPVWPSTRMSPVPPSTTLPFKLVTPTPVRFTPTPVTLFVPSIKAPPAVINVTAAVESVSVPVRFNPLVLSVRLNPPLLEEVPRLSIAFASVKVTEPVAFTVRLVSVIVKPAPCVTPPPVNNDRVAAPAGAIAALTLIPPVAEVLPTRSMPAVTLSNSAFDKPRVSAASAPPRSSASFVSATNSGARVTVPAVAFTVLVSVI